MDWQTILNIAMGVATLIVTAYVKFVQLQLNEARVTASRAAEHLAAFMIKVAENYITHQDLRRIEDALIRIEAKIEVKADK